MRATHVKIVAGWATSLLGVVVLGAWAYVLTARGYEVDEAGTVGYSLPMDYVLFGAGVMLLVTPIVLWVRSGVRRSCEGTD
jgi:hypothetical protein